MYLINKTYDFVKKYKKSTIAFFIFLILIFSSGKEEGFDFYTIKKVVPKKLIISVEASGNVEAISSVEIKSKASGEVLYLGAEVGDLVQKGQVLARIDQRTTR